MTVVVAVRSRRLHLYLVCLAVVLLGQALVQAQAPTPRPETPSLNLYWTDTPPVLDGKMDDPCWKDAEVAGNFTMMTSYSAPSVQTEVRAAYDAANLYLFWTAHEVAMDQVRFDGKEPAKPRARDDSIRYTTEDVIELFLDPGKTGTGFYHLMANPAGCRYDAIASPTVNLTSYDYTPDWQTAPGRAPGAWTLEMRIPISELVAPGLFSGTPQIGDHWGVNFCRSRMPVLHEWSSWSPTYAGFGNPKNFGNLFFRGRKAGAQPPAVTGIKPGPLSYGPGEISLTVTGGQVQGTGELVRDGKKVGDLSVAIQGATVSVPYRLLDAGDYRIRVRLTSGGKLVYAGEAEALLRPGKWEALKTLDRDIAAGRATLKRSQNRHPAFGRLLRDLEDFEQRSAHARAQSARANELTGEEWKALGEEAATVLAEWKGLQFDLHLAKLYPGAKGGRSTLFALGSANEGEKIYRDALYDGSLTAPIRASVAGNEWASFQLAVLPFWARLRDATVSFSELRGPGGTLPADRYLWFRTQYVKVTKADPYDPTVVRYEPDPLLAAAPFEARPGRITPIWVDYKLPAGTPAGIYRGTVTVTANGQSVSRPVELRSYGFDIPVKSSLETDWWLMPLWWRPFYGKQITPYTPEAHARQAEVLGRYRISSFPVDWTTICSQVPIYREANGKFTFDWTTFDKYLKQALDNGTTAISAALSCNSGWTAHLNNPGLTFTERATGKKMTLGEIYKPKSWDWRNDHDSYSNNPLYKDFLVAYVQHLKEWGVNDVSYYELFDEVGAAGFMGMIQHHRFFREVAPDLHLTYFGAAPSVKTEGTSAIGLIDAWAPGLAHLEQVIDGTGGKTELDLINERRATTKEKLWAYTCGEGRDSEGNYTPFMIWDHSYQALRIHGWFAWKNRLDGYLLFMLNAVDGANVKADPAERFPNTEWQWESGPWAGTLIYPGEDWRVIPGQRLANARKGLEDLEYFKVLEAEAKGLDPAKHAALLKRVQSALTVEPEIISTIYLWTKDRSVLEAKRDQLAGLIAEVRAARK